MSASRKDVYGWMSAVEWAKGKRGENMWIAANLVLDMEDYVAELERRLQERPAATEINIYRLTRKDSAYFDEYDGFVIAAQDFGRAMECANEVAADEGKIWADPAKVFIERVGTSETLDEGIVLCAFNAG